MGSGKLRVDQGFSFVWCGGVVGSLLESNAEKTLQFFTCSLIRHLKGCLISIQPSLFCLGDSLSASIHLLIQPSDQPQQHPEQQARLGAQRDRVGEAVKHMSKEPPTQPQNS